MLMITSLYIKIHKKTGLKYFGKTTRDDPYSYLGSGKHWCNHLRKHGNDVLTLRVWQFDDVEKCKQFALKFSIDNSIVSSKSWANMINEFGIGGWPTKWPPGSRDGDKNPMFGKRHSEKVCKASSARLAKTNSLRRWYTNGIKNVFCINHPGSGWDLGRIQKPNSKGFKWYNDGTTQITSNLHPGDGWKPGMLSKLKMSPEETR